MSDPAGGASSIDTALVRAGLGGDLAPNVIRGHPGHDWHAERVAN